MLNRGIFDYKEGITCWYHLQEAQSIKMNICCRNLVLRRIFLIFEEFLDGFKITTTRRHLVDELPAPKPTKPAPPKPVVSSGYQSAEARYSASRRKDYSSSWTSGKVDISEKPSSSRGISEKRPRTEPLEDGEDISDDDFDAPDEHEAYLNVGNTSPKVEMPWGRKPEVPAASFTDEDFPSLGGSAPSSSNAGRGRGMAGRGSRFDDEDDNRTSSWSLGRGRGSR